MNINLSLIPYILIFTALIPAMLALLVARKTNRSLIASSAITFVLGITIVGGCLYLAILNIYKPKPVLESQ